MPILSTKTDRKIYSVSQVTRDLKEMIEDNFQSLWISGEISNFKAASSGHYYFTIKDEQSQLLAVMFRGSNSLLKFELVDGLEVIIHGRLSLYELRGQYQVIVDYAEPKGLGALQLAFEQLKAKLQAEGLFDAKHKQPLPYLPKKIGIITSSKGAALHDMLNILRRRYPNIEILINPVTVQGPTAAGEIAQAIEEMNERDDIDVLIVGRGGGSIEDLWAFNEEPVIRAIFKSQIPIVSAVGHETDVTLADFVADLRAPTPSAAAELVVPEISDLIETVEQHRDTLTLSIKNYFKSLEENLKFLKKNLKSPAKIFAELKDKINALKHQMFLIQKNILSENIGFLSTLSGKLKTLSPLNLLKRGYSVVTKEGSFDPVTSAHQIKTDETVNIRLYDGEVSACISKTRL